MAAMMDDYLDSPMETMENDEVFPCKGCGEILEEGKAFELAGNRWHLNCFRCNTCSTLLDSDANLLLLGDGSLICNNCTYSCSACGNKIEDLAILTGDQAFCATCFRCRNCKRKIENLRYARTSQGIFCMSCHESLMARRRKKSKAASQAKSQPRDREKDASPMITEKSLPALPPNEIPMNAFSSHRVDPESDTPTELSPRPRQAYTHNETSSRSSSRPSRSPERSGPESGSRDGLSLPAPSYRNNRNSSILPHSVEGSATEADSFFIPVALDPSPGPTPRSTSDSLDPSKKSSRDRDFFTAPKPSPPDSKSDSQASTPHIAFQEKGRGSSTEQPEAKVKPPTRKLSKSNRSITAEDKPPRTSSKGPQPDVFKLQEAPRSKKLLSSRTSSQTSSTLQDPSNRHSNGVLRKERTDSLAPTSASPDKGPTPRTSQDSRKLSVEDSRSRSDSSGNLRSDKTTGQGIPRKDLPPSASRTIINGHADGQPAGPVTISRPSSSDESSRPTAGEKRRSDTYIQPRQAPSLPPGQPQHVQAPARDGGHGHGKPSPKLSPKLPRWSAGGEFSMDEDMARILGTDESSSSILRRVSNAVRHGRTNSVESGQPQAGRSSHGRSISETTRATASPKWPKTPIAEDPVNGHRRQISSPLSLPAAGQQEDPALLKRQLRNSEQRVAELERQFGTEKDLLSLNRKLQEKQKTVSVLDTQTEIMIRQLEVLAGYVERAKETKSPVDPRELEESTIKEFVQKLDKVKQSMAAAIEQLHQERDALVDEKNKAVADRDRALLEFEQLSSKNAQLADMNNDLTHQIQERFKQQINLDPKSPGPNGLGIYGTRLGSTDGSSINTSTTMIANEHEEPVVESGPTLINIRKGQVKKFNWKKGSKTIAQNVTKGVNRAVVAFQQDRDRAQQHPGLTGDNIGLPYNLTSQVVESPSTTGPNGQSMRQASERQGFGFFSKGKGGGGGAGGPFPKVMTMNNMSTPTLAEPPSTLFGSDLSERADYERRQLPSVVTRCIEEVERRGMDVEGIYRKTGGNSQVKMIQDGFERDDGFDISDPTVDITAVTSVLKQYFRKLPTPLLTYEVYERVLESNAIANEAERCAHLGRTFASMPQRHGDTLEYLMIHLARVAQQEQENLMSPKNLAVVFAPTIMRDTSLEREMTDMHAKNIAIQFLIENTEKIFVD